MGERTSYGQKDEKPKVEKCPDCGAEMRPSAGCSFCPSCGYSPCKG